MDAPRFDTLTKTMGQRRGRRHVLAGLLGAALLTPLSEAAAAKGGKGRAKRRGRVTSQSNKACPALCKNLFSSKKDQGRCIAQGAREEAPCTCLGSCGQIVETIDGRMVCAGGIFAGCTPCSGEDACSPLPPGGLELEPRCLLSYTTLLPGSIGGTTVMADVCSLPTGTATCAYAFPCP